MSDDVTDVHLLLESKAVARFPAERRVIGTGIARAWNMWTRSSDASVWVAGGGPQPVSGT